MTSSNLSWGLLFLFCFFYSTTAPADVCFGLPDYGVVYPASFLFLGYPERWIKPILFLPKWCLKKKKRVSLVWEPRHHKKRREDEKRKIGTERDKKKAPTLNNDILHLFLCPCPGTYCRRAQEKKSGLQVFGGHNAAPLPTRDIRTTDDGTSNLLTQLKPSSQMSNWHRRCLW